MKEKINISKLLKVIEIAEDTNMKYSSAKQKKIKKLINKAYNLINNPLTTQNEIDDTEKKILNLLVEETNKYIYVILLSSFLLICALVFTGYQTITFIDTVINNNTDKKYPQINENLASLINVNYKETNIVNLNNQLPVTDEIGLKNEAQEFTISNSFNNNDNLNYKIGYQINLIELENNDKSLNKKYIKYRLSYNKNNIEIKDPIKTLDKLEKNSDGSYILFTGIQDKNSSTDFKLVIWIDSNATNNEQNKDYQFMLDVKAVIQ